MSRIVQPVDQLRFSRTKVAAARFGQLFGPRQFRARRRLEARHSCSSLGGLCGSSHSAAVDKARELEWIV